VPARLINIKYITIRAEKVASPVTALHLTDRDQATKLGFHLSSMLHINRSIIQGAGIGPTLFIMFAHDLKPLDILNFLIKYADDATLLSPQNSRHRLNLRWLTS